MNHHSRSLAECPSAAHTTLEGDKNTQAAHIHTACPDISREETRRDKFRRTAAFDIFLIFSWLRVRQGI